MATKAAETTERIVLIDTDAGTDDAMAIIIAIRAHQDKNLNFKIVGITCVDGNTHIDNVTVNVTRILQIVGANDIPIYKGAETALVVPKEIDSSSFHGEDGFGDHQDHISSPVEPKLENEHAVLAIIRLAHQYKKKLTILALAPLTNLALAIRMDPSIREYIKDIYIMGGNTEGMGNATMCAEYNFLTDPESANITLATYHCPIVIVSWEVCLKQGTRSQEWRTNVLGKLNTPAMTLLNKAEDSILKRYTTGWIPCDQLIVAALIDPAFIESKGDYYCTVELSGKHARGQMIVDYRNKSSLPKNATIITKINEELFEKILIWGVGGPSYK